MLLQLDSINNPTMREKIDRGIVKPLIAGGVDEIRTADLVDMSSFSRDNEVFKFILSIVDVFSKYGWLIPLNKKG